MSDDKIRVVWFGEPARYFPTEPLPPEVQVIQAFPDPAADQWETVLANPQIDVVVFDISQQKDSHQNILRTLIQNQIPVVVLVPDADSLFAYEIEMVRVDAGGRLLALLPDRCTAQFEPTSVQALAELYDNSLSTIYHHLTHDLLHLKTALGTPRYVFAMGSRLSDDVRNLTVNVEFESGCLLNWGYGTPDRNSRFQQGTQQSDFDRTIIQPDNLLQTLHQAHAGDHCEPSDQNNSWVEYATTREAAEMISLSLKKGRRIEIFDGNPTESDSFKGVMSTVGCFLLLLALAIITGLAALDIGQISETRDQHLTALESSTTVENDRWPLWLRLWPVYPLGIFLSFQLLKNIIKTERQAR